MPLADLETCEQKCGSTKGPKPSAWIKCILSSINTFLSEWWRPYNIGTSISASGNDTIQLKLSEILKKSQCWIWGEGSKFQVILFEAPIRTFQLVTVYHKWLVNDRSLPGLLTIPCNFYVIPGNQIEQQSCFNPLIKYSHYSLSSISKFNSDVHPFGACACRLLSWLP